MSTRTATRPATPLEPAGGRRSRVLAVVLNWNGLATTDRCVRHLRGQDHPALDLLVVDNGSTDGSARALANGALAAGELLALPENRGFTGGMNAGLEAAEAGGYDFAWLVNNDAFPEPGCLSALVRLMEAEPSVAATTPRIVGLDGADQNYGGLVAWDEARNALLFPGDDERGRGRGFWLTGTALLVRVACLGRVGRLDPRYFAYWEDVDFSHRCREAGYEVKPELAATCLHEGGSSTGGTDSPFALYMNLRNRWLFLKKHLPRRDRPRAFLKAVGGGLELAGILAAHGRHADAAVTAAAVAAVVRGKVGRPRTLSASPGLRRVVARYGWGVGTRLGRAAGLLPGPRA